MTDLFSTKRVGLALSGGVARGPAHVGVLNVLLREGIPIDYVAGVSAGSIIGAALCAGVPLETLNEIAPKINWRHIARLVFPRRGFVSFKKLERFVADMIDDRQFYEMQIPFITVATDLLKGEPVILREGRVASAVHASCAVPGFVEPVERNGQLLGDGGVSCNLPARQVRAMGADYVIGVDLMQPHLRRKMGPLRFGAMAFETLIQRSGGGLDAADCLITPNLAGFNSLRFGQAEYLIGVGEVAARQQLGTIQNALRAPLPHDSTLPVPDNPVWIA
jgi:NTE family protein